MSIAILDVRQHLAAAQALAEAGDYREAAATAREVLAQAPRCLAALRTLAFAQFQLDDAAALDTLRDCILVDPEDAVAEAGQAAWLDLHGASEQATDHYLRAWELEPYDQDLRRAVARRLGELPDSALAEGISEAVHGHNENAATLLRKASALDPPDTAALLALAEVLWRLGGRQQAFNIAAMVAQSNPDSVKATLLLVLREAEAGRTLRVRELIARAQAVDPGLRLYDECVSYFGVDQILARLPVRG